ncbi:hypothetical protein BTHE68_71250 (plasmid) [Burkholderia sp. THE68]|uniref:hypothetical protein n=1 Tax=Burkholderiaceae TaxID=119060 RepID=UPI001316FDF0|nr:MULTISPECIES: hypothetical protein [Burkholderiaceae]BBU33391.1 hypothetical protein BTHE68_71250 [Burkholderia sp. THE68]GJH13633.1 hypothetical protein CBA19CS11_32365 [Caballeronia novacaledonica]
MYSTLKIAARLFTVSLIICNGVSVAQETGTRCSQQINYLSDTDGAYKYLEQLQRHVYAANPNETDPFTRAELNKPQFARTWTDLAKELAAQGCDASGKQCVGDYDLYMQMLKSIECDSIPTRFESPMFIELIRLYTNNLLAVAKADFPGAAEARFGSLPTGTIDAQAMLVPKINQPIVILNRDLFYFTGALSKSISDAIEIDEVENHVALQYSDQAISKRLNEHPYIVRNFADAIVRMIKFGTSKGADEITLDADHNRLHARLVSAMDMFIVAHEESHVLLKHVNDNLVSFALGSAASDAGPGSASAPTTDTSLTIQTRTREQELAADSLGFTLMIRSISRETPDGDPVGVMIAAAAPDIIFRIIDSAESYGRAANGRSFTDANHPLAKDRAEALTPVIEKLRDTGGPLNGVPDFRPVFDMSLATLLKFADPLIRKDLGLPLTVQGN